MELFTAAFGRWGNFAYFSIVASTLIAAGVAMSAALIVGAELSKDDEQSAPVEHSLDTSPRHVAMGASRHAR
ncbi:hypothetical protein [Erythrobacter aureus]|uniref:Uncharacterized protein n=1 Tax=Erythrobacter aureus TaxID=2182384 RepID=A0A345YJ83_9SPHN|nr:hypothetical protein [Erythrobacter aureus]AXK43985.1 hypothetical protein DVR09_16150 [Erythrobacter aureus]